MGANLSRGVINSLAAAIDVNHPLALCKRKGSWLSLVALKRFVYFRTERESRQDFRAINRRTFQLRIKKCAHFFPLLEFY